jgi:hypothetical protein
MTSRATSKYDITREIIDHIIDILDKAITEMEREFPPDGT